jgi:hypothetical protein
MRATIERFVLWHAVALFSCLAPTVAGSVAYAAAVTTEQGVVQGTTAGHVEMLFGIPFAAPPVSDLRCGYNSRASSLSYQTRQELTGYMG